MTPEQLAEILKNHRLNKARCAYLTSKLESLNRWLEKFQGSMINDLVTMSQALSGMPHGTSVGDPTGRLALDIVTGDAKSIFVKEIQEDMAKIRRELDEIYPKVRVIEIMLEGLNDRERIVFEMKMIDDLSWPEILNKMNRLYNNSYSKRTLQRLLDRAVDKACEIIK